MSSPADYIVQLLRKRGLVSENAAGETMNWAAGLTLGDGGSAAVIDHILNRGYTTSKEITQVLASEFAMEVVNLEEVSVSQEALGKVSRGIAERYGVSPLSFSGNKLQLAISDPLDLDAMDNLRHLLGVPVEFRLAPKEDIERAIRRHYQAQPPEDSSESRRGPENERSGSPGGQEWEPPVEPDVQDEAPVAAYVQELIANAVEQRASDIHFEPLAERFRVRFRIDGQLTEALNPPRRMQLSIVSRIKLMAGISIAEKRIPQDGRIRLKMQSGDIHLRVSSLPTLHGESLVMRILDRQRLEMNVSKLGLSREDQAAIEKTITLPDGIMLVTGPTGSGKSTTLYSCLNHINRPDHKIITVEDPVEYQISGINQVQVNRDVGMDFATALRTLLRQAPNVIMIGEIRDRETAEIATHASLTGHLVFSTLHTNDAPGAVSRLLDLGIKPFLVAAALRVVVAQRLLRLNCEQCRRPYVPAKHEGQALGLTKAQINSAQFMRGTGCPHCRRSGYYSRTGVFEVLRVSEEIQQMIYAGAALGDLRREARERGMLTLRQDGVRKVVQGLTTIDEVLAITATNAE